MSLPVSSMPLVNAVGAALIHSVWQGAVLAGAAFGVLWLCRRSRPETRHAVCLVTLVLLAVCPAATLAVIVRDETTVPAWRKRFDPIVQTNGAVRLLRERDAAGTHVESPMVNEAPKGGLSIAKEVPAGHRAAGVAGLPAWAEWSAPALPWLACGWLVGLAAFSLRTALGFGSLAVLVRCSVPAPAETQAVVERLRRKLGLRVLPRVLISERLGDALAAGLLRPVIVAPACWLTALPPGVIEAVLAHELAHIRRRDLWINVLQRTIESLLFFHPAAWWLSGRLRMERELCCDGLAAEATGDHVQYARSLEQAARVQWSSNQVLLATRWGGSKMALLNRVRHVLARAAQPARRRVAWWPAGLLAVVIPALLVAALWTWQPAAAEADDLLALQERDDDDRDDDRDEVRRDRPDRRTDQDDDDGDDDDRDRGERDRDGERARNEGDRRREGDREQPALRDRGPGRDADSPRRDPERRQIGNPFVGRGFRPDDRPGDRPDRPETDADRSRGEVRSTATERELISLIQQLRREIEELRNEVRALREQRPPTGPFGAGRPRLPADRFRERDAGDDDGFEGVRRPPGPPDRPFGPGFRPVPPRDGDRRRGEGERGDRENNDAETRDDSGPQRDAGREREDGGRRERDRERESPESERGDRVSPEAVRDRERPDREDDAF